MADEPKKPTTVKCTMLRKAFMDVNGVNTIVMPGDVVDISKSLAKKWQKAKVIEIAL